ncbi:hypothetical protein FB451DRAFT_1187924 [Mycena latifolia]|nr:hypothetical protein FB451DRAFT_1187924 [Mycena latifolia]
MLIERVHGYLRPPAPPAAHTAADALARHACPSPNSGSARQPCAWTPVTHWRVTAPRALRDAIPCAWRPYLVSLCGDDVALPLIVPVHDGLLLPPPVHMANPISSVQYVLTLDRNAATGIVVVRLDTRPASAAASRGLRVTRHYAAPRGALLARRRTMLPCIPFFLCLCTWRSINSHAKPPALCLTTHPAPSTLRVPSSSATQYLFPSALAPGCALPPSSLPIFIVPPDSKLRTLDLNMLFSADPPRIIGSSAWIIPRTPGCRSWLVSLKFLHPDARLWSRMGTQYRIVRLKTCAEIVYFEADFNTPTDSGSTWGLFRCAAGWAWPAYDKVTLPAQLSVAV